MSSCLDIGFLADSARALDIGCAVGRASFELARHCISVIGIDRSLSFIKVARELREKGTAAYERVDEGLLTTRCFAKVPYGIERHRVTFEAGDALNLNPGLGAFDVVLAANLICRLPDPARFLRGLHGIVKPGGQLILTSPYTWLDEFTSCDNWLGGFTRPGGGRVATFETVQALLNPHFTLSRRKDVPFLIREHERKYQWSVADATMWRRL